MAKSKQEQEKACEEKYEGFRKRMCERVRNEPLVKLLGMIAGLCQDVDCTCVCKAETWMNEYETSQKDIELSRKLATEKEIECKKEGRYENCPQRIAYERCEYVLKKADNNAICEWISANDRLPEIRDHHVSDTVLVWCQSEEVMTFSELEENCFGGYVFGVERANPYGDDAPEVTHWMPLPKPPAMEE